LRELAMAVKLKAKLVGRARNANAAHVRLNSVGATRSWALGCGEHRGYAP